MRYGNVRDLVLAATIVMPDGRVIRAGRPVVKNVAGYDLPKLFVGSYGTLGLITDVSLKLVPLPRARASLTVPVPTLAQGLQWGGQLLRVCLVASSLLLCDAPSLLGQGSDVAGTSAAPYPYVLIYTAEGMPEDVEAELAQVRRVLQSAGASGLSQRDAPSGSEAWAEWLRAGDGQTVVRAAVAPKDLSRLAIEVAPGLGAPSLRGDSPSPRRDGPSLLADLASGMLYTRSAPVDATRRAARAMGGYAVVLSGPAADRWGYVPDGLDLMQALKARWDAGGLFNPGVHGEEGLCPHRP